ncbi:MAG TPA: formate-dependent phosphoribosylglycinamide formyltransferase [Polyangiales bacterium]|nr:formate-dependent phosphoribosylglycinamide formyltransferase [Polyangiales bacterium]
MIRFGTPATSSELKLLLLGSGELGKEVALEAQRLGVTVIAVDRYAQAPAMQVAHRSHVITMTDASALRRVVLEEKPDFIVPELEAIATATLLELEQEGFHVIPTARATHLTMNREGIRRLVAEQLGLRTSPYAFASDKDEYLAALEKVGFPCVVKPIMSSSGKGQSLVRDRETADRAYKYAQENGRTGAGKVIVEGFVDFDYEITLLTVRHAGGTSFCSPIGHRQVFGDYHESWQPQAMSEVAYREAERIAKAVTDELGGRGLFGVELFVKGDEVIFSEVSPRPHDTGMVTMISQDLSEFALHVRAILGLPIPNIRQHGASASYVVLGEGHSDALAYEIDDAALAMPDTSLRLFGKPTLRGQRRLGVALARGATIAEARDKAKQVASAVRVIL